MNFETFLRFAVEQHASDVHLQAESPPALRIDGLLRSVEGQSVPAGALQSFLELIAPADIAPDLKQAAIRGEAFVHTVDGLARFRCQLFNHRERPGASLRIIPLVPRPLEHLQLPATVAEIATARQGLVLITGTAGSGRSTTLAAIVDAINHASVCQIITIEQPVEFVYPLRKALITQQSVGVDTLGFACALEHALRTNPDVVVLGAIPDAATARSMLQAAESGKQVFGIVDAATTLEAIQRVLLLVPAQERPQAQHQLGTSLEAVVGQRLVMTRDGKRRPAVEILRGGPMVSRSLAEGRLNDVGNFLTGRQGGMQSFDQHLAEMHQAGIISGTEAMRRSTNPETVAAQLRAARATVRTAS